MKRSVIVIISLIVIICISVALFFYYNTYIKVDDIKEPKKSFSYQYKDNIKEENSEEEIIEIPKENIKTLTISAAGDCTLGYDDKFGYSNSFNQVLEKNNNDYSYFFKNVKNIFSKDDITIVNLEGTLTEATTKREKAFNFKGSPEYAKILIEGSVEVANIANNHSHDYEEEGYLDTKNALEQEKIEYVGNSSYYIKDINGIKVGMFGIMDINSERYPEISKKIKYLKEQNCNLIIANMHWGIEKDYVQNAAQIKMGHYLIDNGVDLVIGTHPHVIQGIEKYNNKYIVYSLANFVFGGNKNPADKDSFIYQQTFTFKDNELQNDDKIKLIPVVVTSDKKINNYQPVLADDIDSVRILDKIKSQSSGFEYEW